MPIYHPLINTNWYMTLTLLFFIAVSFFVYHNQRGSFNILASIFTPTSTRDYNTPVPNINIGVIILSIFALMGYSTLILYIIPAPDTWLNFGICIGIVFVFFLIKYLIINLFFNVMYTGVEKNFISRYHQYNVLSGLICYIGCLILAFTFDGSRHTATITAIILGILYIIGVSYIFITTFFTNLLSVLRLFMYLCTLEILPLLTLVKVLGLV